MPTRRAFLNLCIALALVRRARAASEGASTPGALAAGVGADLSWLELPLAGERGPGRRAIVMYPTATQPGQTYPGLLLFHGRGETSNDSVAIHAWRTLYGLERSDARLRRPPIDFAPEQRRFIEPAQLDAIHRRLEQKPFSGLCVICPVTPNPHRSAEPARVLGRYSEWIEHTLLPAARTRAPLDSTRLGVDGCSLGGYVAAEIFARKPHLFRSFGVVQPAVGAFRVPRYARHLARAMKRETLLGIHLQTSTRDPYRGAVRTLARHLKKQGARFTLDVLPGPHDQQWLRAAGTLAMLAWHDYILS